MSKTKETKQKKEPIGETDTVYQPTLHPQNTLLQLQGQASRQMQQPAPGNAPAQIRALIAEKKYHEALDKIAQMKGFSLQGMQIHFVEEPESTWGPMKFSMPIASFQKPLAELVRTVAEHAYRAQLLAKFDNFQSSKTPDKGKLLTDEEFESKGAGYTTCGDTLIEIHEQLNLDQSFQIKEFLSKDLQSRARAIQPMNFHEQKEEKRIEDLGDAWNDPIQKPGQRPKPGDILILDKQGGRSLAGMAKYDNSYLLHRRLQEYFWNINQQEGLVKEAQRQVDIATRILGLVQSQENASLQDKARLALNQAYQDLKQTQADLEKAKQVPSQFRGVGDLAEYQGDLDAILEKIREKDRKTEFNRDFAHVCYLKEIRKPAPYAPDAGLEIWETFDGGQGLGNDVKPVVREYNPRTNELSNEIDEQSGKLLHNKPGRWLKVWIDSGKILDI